MSVSLMKIGEEMRNQSATSMGSFIDNFNAYYENEFGFLFNLFADQDNHNLPISQIHYDKIQK